MERLGPDKRKVFGARWEPMKTIPQTHIVEVYKLSCVMYSYCSLDQKSFAQICTDAKLKFPTSINNMYYSCNSIFNYADFMTCISNWKKLCQSFVTSAGCSYQRSAHSGVFTDSKTLWTQPLFRHSLKKNNTIPRKERACARCSYTCPPPPCLSLFVLEQLCLHLTQSLTH